MNAAPDVATVETPDDDARIAAVLSLLSDSDFCELKSILQKRFGLEYAETSAHPYNIKTTITGKKIVFSKGVSAASRAFMVLHSLGHYYFICEARRKKIERYSYIYTTCAEPRPPCIITKQKAGPTRWSSLPK